MRSDNKIYRGSLSGNYQVEYTAPAGNFRHINTAPYEGPIWAVRDNGGISACVSCNVGGVVPVTGEIPAEYLLKQNYPNPFNPSTTLEFAIPLDGNVKLCVYSSIGQQVEILTEGNLKAGAYAINWDASKYSSGIYYYSLIASDNSGRNFIQTRKMILVK